MELLNVASKINPENDKSNITHSFSVPKGISKLIIEFSYSPKALEDEEAALSIIQNALEKYEIKNRRAEEFLPVTNLVTLSLDSPEGYIGCAHRPQNVQRHEISKSASSKGFECCEIISGIWKIVLNVHCAVCDIDYRLTVQGGAEE